MISTKWLQLNCRDSVETISRSGKCPGETDHPEEVGSGEAAPELGLSNRLDSVETISSP